MNVTITKQRNLMQKAIQYYEDIEAIKRNFDKEDVMVNLKIELLQDKYAETVTELAQLMLSTIHA